MIHSLKLYSPEEPTPRQFDALKTLLDQYRAETGMLIKADNHKPYRTGQKILVLGSQGPEDVPVGDNEFIYTYSLPQFQSRPNAASVFFAALDNYFERTAGLPDGVKTAEFFNASFVARQFRENFDLTQPIAVDVETGGVLGENVTPRTAPMLTIAFAQGSHAVTLVMDSDEEWDGTREAGEERVLKNLQWLREFLPKIEKPIFHNGKFDIAVIENNTGVRMPNWFDTMLAHHVLNHAAREHGLKALCRRYFNADDWEADIKKWVKGKQKDYSTIPIMVLANYNSYDVLWTYRLWQKLSVEIEADEQAQMALFLEMQAADFLADVEANGIPFSNIEAERLRENYQVQASNALTVMQGLISIQGFNPASVPQVKKALAEFGVNAKGTSEEIIDTIKDEAGEGTDLWRFCHALILYRKAKKMMSTYLDAWQKASRIEGDNRVHPSFNVHGTTTGRLSSSDPNAQNVPREKMIRGMVTIEQDNGIQIH